MPSADARFSSLRSLRLAELLSHHSRLSESIILEPRPVPHYFLVSYFGPFPLAVRNRQFVYRGADWEKLTGFLDRLQNKHPSARLIKADFVPDDVRSGQDLCIQVLPVVAEPDRSKSVLRPDVPREVRSYYEAKCALALHPAPALPPTDRLPLDSPALQQHQALLALTAVQQERRDRRRRERR